MIALDNFFLKITSQKAQFLLGFLFFAFSCSDRLKEFQINGETMGTTYSIKLIVSENIEDPRGIKNSVDSILIDINNQMSTWIKDSEISIFNKTLSTNSFKISDEFFYVLEQGKIINELTDGAFDYTVFSLAASWGFGPDSLAIINDPSDDKIEEILSYTGSENILLDYTIIKKTHPNLQ